MGQANPIHFAVEGRCARSAKNVRGSWTATLPNVAEKQAVRLDACSMQQVEGRSKVRAAADLRPHEGERCQNGPMTNDIHPGRSRPIRNRRNPIAAPASSLAIQRFLR